MSSINSVSSIILVSSFYLVSSINLVCSINLLSSINLVSSFYLLTSINLASSVYLVSSINLMSSFNLLRSINLLSSFHPRFFLMLQGFYFLRSEYYFVFVTSFLYVSDYCLCLCYRFYPIFILIIPSNRFILVISSSLGSSFHLYCFNLLTSSFQLSGVVIQLVLPLYTLAFARHMVILSSSSCTCLSGDIPRQTSTLQNLSAGYSLGNTCQAFRVTKFHPFCPTWSPQNTICVSRELW